MTTFILLVAFYGVSLIDPYGYGVDTHSIFVEYGPIGLLSGFAMAVTARWLTPWVAARPVSRTLACCSAFALLHAATWALSGWGVDEVATSSGVLRMGASLVDVIVSSAIVLAFCWGVIAYAVRGLAKESADERVLSR